MKPTTAAATLALGSLALAGGCNTGTILGLGAAGSQLAVIGGGAGAMAVGTGATIRYGHFGPRVEIHNETSADAAVRLWVGKVNTRDPMGVTDIRTGDDLAVVLEPGACTVRRPDKRAWPTALDDAVVWAHIAPADGTGEPTWIAFERGGPFELYLVDTDAGLAIDAHRTSPHAPLPTERRIIDRVGEHPVWNSPDGAG